MTKYSDLVISLACKTIRSVNDGLRKNCVARGPITRFHDNLHVRPVRIQRNSHETMLLQRFHYFPLSMYLSHAKQT